MLQFRFVVVWAFAVLSAGQVHAASTRFVGEAANLEHWFTTRLVGPDGQFQNAASPRVPASQEWDLSVDTMNATLSYNSIGYRSKGGPITAQASPTFQKPGTLILNEYSFQVSIESVSASSAYDGPHNLIYSGEGTRFNVAHEGLYGGFSTVSVAGSWELHGPTESSSSTFSAEIPVILFDRNKAIDIALLPNGLEFDTQTDDTEEPVSFSTTLNLFDGELDGIQVQLNFYSIRFRQFGDTILLSKAPGDFNLDGNVGIADYTVWRNSLGQQGEALPADGNGDRIVDVADYLFWKSRFGPVNASAATGLRVPEPATVSIPYVLAWSAVVGVSLRRPLSGT